MRDNRLLTGSFTGNLHWNFSINPGREYMLSLLHTVLGSSNLSLCIAQRKGATARTEGR